MSKTGKKQEKIQDAPHPGKPEPEHTGQYLKRIRTEKGLTIKDVAEATRISVVNLNAIEEQNFSALPADTFTRGFLSLYAKFLGIDPAETVKHFMEERETARSGGRKARPSRQQQNLFTPKTLAEPSHFSSATTAVILLIILVVLFTAFCLYTSWNPFGFLVSGRKQSFDSIMMGLEQSFPYNSGGSLETSPKEPLPEKKESFPAGTDSGEETRNPPGDAGERKKQVPDSAYSASPGEPVFLIADRSGTENGPGMLIFAQDRQSPQGDD
jgi:cytoskeletal protein RodZ